MGAAQRRRGSSAVGRRQAAPHLPAPHSALHSRTHTQIAEARQCIYRNHLFLSSLLSVFREGGDDDDCWAPPHLAPANAAADEYEDRVGAAVAPADHDKVRCGVGAGAGGGEAGHQQLCCLLEALPSKARLLLRLQCPCPHHSWGCHRPSSRLPAPLRRPPRRYILKNVARDWSAEGADERAASYGRVTAELQRLFGGWPAGAEPPASRLPCPWPPWRHAARRAFRPIPGD